MVLSRRTSGPMTSHSGLDKIALQLRDGSHETAAGGSMAVHLNGNCHRIDRVRNHINRVVLLWAVFTGVTASCAADQVFGEVKDKYHWFKTVVIPKKRITLPEMEEIARGFLKSAGTSRRILVLSAFPSRAVAGMQNALTCDSYRQWRFYYDKAPKDIVGAEMISIQGNAVLGVRRADGSFTRLVLAGSDPTKFTSGGVSFEVLHLSPRTISRFECAGVPGTVQPLANVRTNETLTPEVCRRAFEVLAKILGSERLFASFRNDHWFLCGPFPLLYMFAEPQVPPPERTYGESLSFTCGFDCDGPSSCIMMSGPELSKSWE
jgi:hypothetical protein